MRLNCLARASARRRAALRAHPGLSAASLYSALGAGGCVAVSLKIGHIFIRRAASSTKARPAGRSHPCCLAGKPLRAEKIACGRNAISSPNWVCSKIVGNFKPESRRQQRPGDVWEREPFRTRRDVSNHERYQRAPTKAVIDVWVSGRIASQQAQSPGPGVSRTRSRSRLSGSGALLSRRGARLGVQSNTRNQNDLADFGRQDNDLPTRRRPSWIVILLPKSACSTNFRARG
jgi:hypothetical protein